MMFCVYELELDDSKALCSGNTKLMFASVL